MMWRLNSAVAALLILAPLALQAQGDTVLIVEPLALEAQAGTVQNAATYPVSSSANPATLQIPLAGGFYANVGVPYFPDPANQISPRMLAVLSYPAVGTVSSWFVIPPQPVTATLSLRPSGSAAGIPIIPVVALDGLVTFVVPAGVPLGGAELIYKIDGRPTQWMSVNVVQSSPALFRSAYGGPAISQTQNATGMPVPIGLSTPARPGQTLLLQGSGLGYGASVSATIGGVTAPVTYAGPHPTQSGFDRFLIQIPPGVTDGCYVPVSLMVNQTALTTTIAETADGSPCKHPWQLSSDDMKTLDTGGSLLVGEISLDSSLNAISPALTSRTDSGSFSLGFETADGMASNFGTDSVNSVAACGAVTPSSVGIFATAGFLGSAPALPPLPDLGAQILLRSTGISVTLNGNGVAGGISSAWYTDSGVFASADGTISSLPRTLISAGQMTWQSQGGADLPATSVNFTLAQPIQIAGSAPVAFRSGQDQTIAWNALDSGTVYVSLQVGGNPVAVCNAPAGAGKVTIPAMLFGGNPAGSLGILAAVWDRGYASAPHATLRLHDGSSLLLFISGSSSDSRPVVIQ